MLGAATTGLVAGLAGCLSEPTFPDADVIAGPGGRNVFEPETVTVSVGEWVRWGFASAGHNVCGRPEDSEDVVLPSDAQPFGSYGPDESAGMSLVPRGGTYEHRFDTTGRYEYVCIPHASVGMAGMVQVE